MRGRNRHAIAQLLRQTTAMRVSPELMLIVIPLAVVAIWVFVTAMLASWSGWLRLQKRYAAPADTAPDTVSIHLITAWVGGVRFNNVLRIGANRDGIRLSVFRLIGIFQKPLFIPWIDVTARPGETMRFLGETARVELGKAADSEILVLPERDWRQIEAARSR